MSLNERTGFYSDKKQIFLTLRLFYFYFFPQILIKSGEKQAAAYMHLCNDGLCLRPKQTD